MVIPPVLAKLVAALAQIVAYVRSQPIVPADSRRALAHRDHGCLFHRFHRIMRDTQAHHVLHPR